MTKKHANQTGQPAPHIDVPEAMAALEAAGFTAKRWEKGGYTRLYLKRKGEDIGYVSAHPDGLSYEGLVRKPMAVRSALEAFPEIEERVGNERAAEQRSMNREAAATDAEDPKAKPPSLEERKRAIQEELASRVDPSERMESLLSGKGRSSGFERDYLVEPVGEGQEVFGSFMINDSMVVGGPQHQGRYSIKISGRQYQFNAAQDLPAWSKPVDLVAVSARVCVFGGDLHLQCSSVLYSDNEYGSTNHYPVPLYPEGPGGFMLQVWVQRYAGHDWDFVDDTLYPSHGAVRKVAVRLGLRNEVPYDPSRAMQEAAKEVRDWRALKIA